MLKRNQILRIESKKQSFQGSGLKHIDWILTYIVYSTLNVQQCVITGLIMAYYVKCRAGGVSLPFGDGKLLHQLSY